MCLFRKYLPFSTAEVVLDIIVISINSISLSIRNGTSNYHPNKAPDQRSQLHAKRGYDLSSLRARQLSTQDF